MHCVIRMSRKIGGIEIYFEQVCVDFDVENKKYEYLSQMQYRNFV